MRVVVIGAGVVGSAVALRLAEAGAHVTVLDAGRAGEGTSAGGFAQLNSNEKTPRDYHDLNLAGMREHRVLAEEIGSGWLHPVGHVEWAAAESDRAYLRGKVGRLRSWGYAVDSLTLAELRALEPELTVTEGEADEVFFYPEEGWVDGPALVRALLERARVLGVTVMEHAPVTGLPVSGGRIAGVESSGGRTVAADVVVNCAGPAADRLAALAGSALPLANTAGFMAVTAPGRPRVRTIVQAPVPGVVRTGAPGDFLGGGGREADPSIWLRMDSADRLVLASIPVESSYVRAGAGAARAHADRLMALARRVLPGLADATVAATRAATRPIPRDGRPAVGPLPGVDNFYAVVTHSGVTLAPLLARLAARELVHGVTEPVLSGYRPSRFV